MGDPYHTLIEAFKLIEYNKFPDFYKYYALRNIAAHFPYDDYLL
jgi:hypothetical protein